MITSISRFSITSYGHHRHHYSSSIDFWALLLSLEKWIWMDGLRSFEALIDVTKITKMATGIPSESERYDIPMTARLKDSRKWVLPMYIVISLEK